MPAPLPGQLPAWPGLPAWLVSVAVVVVLLLLLLLLLPLHPTHVRDRLIGLAAVNLVNEKFFARFVQNIYVFRIAVVVVSVCVCCVCVCCICFGFRFVALSARLIKLGTFNVLGRVQRAP